MLQNNNYSKTVLTFGIELLQFIFEQEGYNLFKETL